MTKDSNPLYETRRSNFLTLLEQCNSKAELASKLEEYPNVVSDIVAGKRPIGDKKARHYEERLGRPKFWFDKIVHNQHLVRLSDDEMHLINYFRLADDPGKRNILDAAHAISQFDEELKKAI